MPRPSLVRMATREELYQLHAVLAARLAAAVRRRALAIVLHTAGCPATDIAAVLQVHRQTIYTDLRAFAASGVACLEQFRTGGAPTRLTAAQRTTICQLAQQAPTDVGVLRGRWSLATLRAYLLRRGVVGAISREHLRRVLQAGGIRFHQRRRRPSRRRASGQPQSAERFDAVADG